MYSGLLKLVLFLSYINYSLTSNIIEREQNKIDKNLKLLRNDFNKLIDNVEDFASNFLKEIEDIGKIMPQGSIFDQDYNWENHDSNTIPKDSEYSPSLTLTHTSADSNMANGPNKKYQQTIRDYVTEKNIFKSHIVSRPKRSPESNLKSSQNNKLTNAELDENRQAAILGSAKHSPNQEITDSKVTTESCASKAELSREMVLEQQKLQNLKAEVRKLNKLVALLKNQQELINDVADSNLENSSLYKTIQSFGQQRDDNIKVKKMNKQDLTSEEVKPSKESTYFQEVSELKLNLHKNEEILNKTKEILLIERKKGEELEIELKRQNSELKFLKAMMENLYDKSTSVTQPRSLINISRKDNLKNRDLKDLDIDDILGSVPAPRSLPNIKQLRTKRQDSESSIKEKLDKIFAEVHKEYINKNNKKNQQFEQDFLNNLTENALIQLTKSDPHGLREPEENLRASVSSEYRDSDLKRFLSALKSQSELEEENSKRASAPNKDNGTSEIRTRSNNKNEDVLLKLKVLDMLSNKEAKSEDTSKNENLAETLKSLLEPEKKSDDSILLEKLINMVKEKQEPPKVNNKEKLAKLLQSLTTPKPQSKADDDIENELKELQLAINNLKPKDDSNTINSIGLENNRRGKDESQDFQSMLSQIISQNNVEPSKVSTQSSVNLASNISPQPIATPQLLSQFISSHNPQISSASQNDYSQFKNFLKLYESNSPYFKPTSANYGSGANSLGGTSFGLTSPYENQKLSGYGSNLNSYVPYPNSIFSPSINTYESLGQNVQFSNANPIMTKYQPTEFNKFVGGFYSPSYSQKTDQYGPIISYDNHNQGANYYPYSQHFIVPPQNNYGVKPTSFIGKYNTNSNLGQPEYPTSSAALYSGISNSDYGGRVTQGNSGTKNKFQYSPNPGRDYQDASFASRGYSGSTLDKPYSATKDTNEYRNSMIYDLNQQIQSLERIINGLTKTDGYYQSPEDKTAVAGLEEKISSLKGIIESLNQPTYSLPQPQPLYKQQRQYTAKFNQKESLSNSQPNEYKFPAPANEYKFNDKQYESNRQDNSNVAYAEQGPTFYAATESPLPSASTPGSYPSGQYPYQPSSPSQPPNISNYNPLPPNQPIPPPYQSKELQEPKVEQHAAAYQPPTSLSGEASAAYQPKQSTASDRVDNIRRKKLEFIKSQTGRKRRQVQDGNEVNFNADQSQVSNREYGYELGNDAFLQIANTFKKYLEDNITDLKLSDENMPESNQKMRTNGLNELQNKLETLKLQLESQKPLPTFLPGVPTPYLPQGSVQPIDKSKSIITSLSLNNKKQDIFTDIVVKVVQKLLNALPEVLNIIFGNIFTNVGGASGDYSPVQNILKNLGALGYLPLVAIKILDSLGLVLTHLNKNQFFKQFLLPGISLLLIGGVVLFLVFFYQQNNNPYGYLEYQSNSLSNYPRYEHLDYNKPYSVSPYYNTREIQNIADYRPSLSKIDNYERIKYNIPDNTATNLVNVPRIPYSRGYLNYYDSGRNRLS
ncbi:uncharacterized protein LOC126735412 isoform X2 [Anthonomus grandis grandis]|uniref:uncharacterized protein LOC126735412 isoform X2 n=1 Tax=Anthonomus grandis grandis TaxID=2921223 RepID=UPI002166419C|nr:uncharacterized protein LOC126735412 isoform X2 [Anthonomus grandis grandis]